VRKLLIIAPTARERRDLHKIAEPLGIELLWDDFAGDYFDDFVHDAADMNRTIDTVALIEACIKKHEHANLSGVSSAVGYPGMSVVAVVAERLGLPGPKPDAIMLCEHKYLARKIQSEIVPDATPWFHLLDPKQPDAGDGINKFPIFIKPVKSCMSMNAFRIEDKAELATRLKQTLLPRRFYQPFDDMVHAYANLAMGSGYILAEDLLKGDQVSLEGYAFNGQPVVLGIIDAIMFPGTFSFKRFQYPSRLPESVQTRMRETAAKLLRGINYDNAMFNMEFIWDPDTDRVSIIEVNPKIASQFPDLFQKVDGTNTYRTMLQIAVGDKPDFVWGNGQFTVAASCVLRIFEDKKVISKPSNADLQKVKELYPDAMVQIMATEDKNLSEQLQDTASFRYGLINIGAESQEALEAKFEHVKSMLPFQFESVNKIVQAKRD
jgi:biotin carboxylase